MGVGHFLCVTVKFSKGTDVQDGHRVENCSNKKKPPDILFRLIHLKCWKKKISQPFVLVANLFYLKKKPENWTEKVIINNYLKNTLGF